MQADPPCLYLIKDNKNYFAIKNAWLPKNIIGIFIYF